MSSRINVSLYIARVHERGDKKYQRLDQLDGGVDFVDFFHTLLQARHNEFVTLSEGRRRMRIAGELTKSNRVVDGILEVGRSGFTSTLRNDESGEETYRRQQSDAEMIPLYFRMWSPSDATFAAFAFQHFGDYGCKTPVHELLYEGMKARFPALALKMREAVPGEVVDRFFRKGLVKQLRFVHFGIPSDRADAYSRVISENEEANVELRIVAKRGRGLSLSDAAKRFLGREEISAKQFLELDGVQYNRFKMKVNMNGRDKWLSVGEFMSMHSRLDVTADLKMQPNGHPQRGSIAEICQALLEKVGNETQG